MNITTILGSPRRNGNTAMVLREFERLARPVATIHRINVVDLHLSGCRGCERCQRVVSKPGCIQGDALNQILSGLITTDMVVYAAPVYVWDFPAQMKALMDRHYCMAKNTSSVHPSYLLRGKATALLTTCGGSAEKNADLLCSIFEREMAYLRCRVIGEYVLPYCTTGQEMRERARRLASDMSRELVIGSR